VMFALQTLSFTQLIRSGNTFDALMFAKEKLTFVRVRLCVCMCVFEGE